MKAELKESPSLALLISYLIWKIEEKKKKSVQFFIASLSIKISFRQETTNFISLFEEEKKIKW